MSKQNLISHSYAERIDRHNQNIRKLLAFMRMETWTTARVAALVVGYADHRSINRPLTALVRDGLIVVERVKCADGRTETIAGITSDGQAIIAAILQKPMVLHVYERGKVGLTTLAHRVDLQMLRVTCAHAGWREWQYPDRQEVTKKNGKDAHRPDAIAQHPGGLRVALEVERTVKTLKRYRFIAGRHLEAVGRGEYDRVIYAASGEARARALRAVFASLKYVVAAGRQVPIADDFSSQFLFCCYQQLPTLEVM